MRNIFTKAIEGINKLKVLYRDNHIVVQCLQYYIIIIESFLSNKQSELDAIGSDVLNEYSAFKESWTSQEINIIVILFDYLSDQSDRDRIERTHDCIEQFLNI
jgi:hypothetical protein